MPNQKQLKKPKVSSFIVITLLILGLYASFKELSGASVVNEFSPPFARNSSETSSTNSSGVSSQKRAKRQYGNNGYISGMAQCPAGCFPCTPMQCQSYQMQCMPQMPRIVNLMSCCCIPLMPAKPDLKTACDGEEAVAGCLNGLCGQGYFCSKRKFCCRCQTGKSVGPCVNGLCPAGYACNSNNYCCAIGSSSVLGPCINDLCPAGYECGAGDLCYQTGGLPRDFEVQTRGRNGYVRRNEYIGRGKGQNYRGKKRGGKGKKKYLPSSYWDWESRSADKGWDDYESITNLL